MMNHRTRKQASQNHQGLRRMLAWAAAMMLLAAPALATAEVDFDPGTLYVTLADEAYQGGRQVETTLKWQLDQAQGLSEEELAMAQKLLEQLEVRVSSTDDIDRRIYSFAVALGGKTIADALIIEDAKDVRLSSSLLPGAVLRMPNAWKSSGGLSLFSMNYGESADTDVLVDAYINYFGILAAWVSQKQVDREDLYLYEPVEIEDSETRDAASLEMRSRVRPDDLKELLRAFADLFYNDEPVQEAVTRMFAGQGVTRAAVRRFADQLPLWISHGLEPTGKATEFVFSYDDDMGIVGFDGVMPAMYEKYFFRSGELHYDRKTLVEGVTHSARGALTLNDAKTLAGELQFYVGDPFENTRRDERTLRLELADPATGLATESAIFMQDQYLAAENLDTYDGVGKIDLTQRQGEAESRLHGEYSVHSETKIVGDLDFACDTTLQLDVTEILSLTMECAIASKEYVPVELPTGAAEFDLENLTPEQQAQLQEMADRIPMMIMLSAADKLPPELLQVMLGQ